MTKSVIYLNTQQQKRHSPQGFLARNVFDPIKGSLYPQLNRLLENFTYLIDHTDVRLSDRIRHVRMEGVIKSFASLLGIDLNLQDLLGIREKIKAAGFHDFSEAVACYNAVNGHFERIPNTSISYGIDPLRIPVLTRINYFEPELGLLKLHEFLSFVYGKINGRFFRTLGLTGPEEQLILKAEAASLIRKDEITSRLSKSIESTYWFVDKDPATMLMARYLRLPLSVRTLIKVIEKAKSIQQL
jgi:hypothetical protein